MSAAAGYSGTPLAQKLGLKDGQHVLFVDLPESLLGLLRERTFADMRQVGAEDLGTVGGGFDYVHLFTRSRAVLEGAAQSLRGMIVASGMVWVSWPKKASKVATDLTEDVIRDVLLPTGLVDVKVAAVDEVWSGLKLMIRKELR